MILLDCMLFPFAFCHSLPSHMKTFLRLRLRCWSEKLQCRRLIICDWFFRFETIKLKINFGLNGTFIFNQPKSHRGESFFCLFWSRRRLIHIGGRHNWKLIWNSINLHYSNGPVPAPGRLSLCSIFLCCFVRLLEASSTMTQTSFCGALRF